MRSKPWRPIGILIFLVLMLLVVGYGLAERQGLLVGLMASLALVYQGVFRIHDSFIERLDGYEVEGQDPWGMSEKLTRAARDIKIGHPRLFFVPDRTASAFILGRTWRQGRVIFTEGALQKLNVEEREILLTFLLCQIRRGDGFGFGLAQTLGSLVLFPATLIDKGLSRLTRAKSHIELLQPLVAPFAALIIRTTIGQRRYLECDREAAQTLRDPEGVARVLWKLQSWATSCPLRVPVSGAHMFIVNPLTSKSWKRYFHNQPSVARRIQLLVGRFPI